jgi:hypothetical protein
MAIRLPLGALVVLLVAGLAGSADDPQAKWDDSVGKKVVEFAKRNVGKQVGDGECVTLAIEALKSAGGKSFGDYKGGPDPADLVWGELVYALEITPTLRTESTAIGTTVKAGDVVQFRDTKFAGNLPGGAFYASETPQHTAVVTGVSINGKTIEVLQQNVNGKKTVSTGTVRLNDLKSGRVKVYRPQK